MSDPIRTQPHRTELTEPYWAGCREGELRLQRCRGCGRHQFYPRIFCSHCGHGELDWVAASGVGRIASFSIMERPVSKAYPSPTVIVLVDLAEGTRMMSSLVGADPTAVEIGAPVSVEFEDWSESTAMPVFRLITEETAI